MGFDAFLGNPQAAQTVRHFLSGKRVPGAILFTGPEGVGKKTLALMFAKAMVCERRGPEDNDFCGQCPRCLKAEEMIAAAREDLGRRRLLKDASRRLEGLVYFDVQLIEPITRYILTEQIRELRNVAYTHPFEFPRRVFVIDEAQLLHWQAIDLLLKVLEEPPETTTIILVCPNVYELRSTIRSRCQRVTFSPVEDSIIKSVLPEVARLKTPQRELAVRLCAGSVAKAKTFDASDYEQRRRPWIDFLGSLAGGKSPGGVDWKSLFDSTRALSENRDEFERTLQIGYSLLRDIVQVRQTGSEAGVTNLDLVSHLRVWGANLGLGQVEKLKSALDEASRLQIRNINNQMGLDALAADLVGNQH